MAQGFERLPDDSANTGKRLDQWVTATQGYYREGVVIADPSVDANVAPVSATLGLSVNVQGVQVTVPAGLVGVASGGLLNFHLVSIGSTNANNVKASAGQLYGVRVFNNAPYPVYIKFYNTAGTPTPGTGVVKTVGVQAGTARDVEIPTGMAFSTGIGLSITKGLADADATAVLAADCVVDLEYF